jgi:Uma2 family endonuclease
MGALPKAKMTAEEYLRWSEHQDVGRHELVGGEVVMISPETLRHVRLKNEIWLTLRNALRSAGSSCEAFGDGVGIRIDQHTVREPDASIQCGPVDQDSLLIDEPVVVVEVVSLSSIRSDSGAKVAEYFRVASVRHYLIIDPYGASIVHHAREGNSIRTNILTDGSIELVPPGIIVEVVELLGGIPGSRDEENA